jgi:threonine/homoserine/homoserine lactone efflux protein
VFGQGLEDRRSNAFWLALGSALAESVYAYLAFWGFSAFLIRYPWIERTAHFGASIVFIALGAHFYRKRNDVPKKSERPANTGNKRSFLLGLTLTALNPTLIATWTFTVTTVYSFGLVKFDAANALPFSLGALLGIIGWFATLLHLLDRFRLHLAELTIQRVLHVMGIVLMVVGVVIGLTVSRPYFTKWFV